MTTRRKRPRPICGAITRKGLPCQCKVLLRGNRCSRHGGKSTGPRTPEGKAASIAAMRAGWEVWRRRITIQAGKVIVLDTPCPQNQ